jgi:CubicO group peptidase (beta-lactamase class C family)
MNPAGGVQCSIDDFARYAREYLAGARGQGSLCDAAGYMRILSVQGTATVEEMYLGAEGKGTLQLGYGWGVEETSAGTAFVADGTGGTFYARIGLLPDKGLAFVALANSGNAEPAITDAQTFLLGKLP